MIDKKSRKIIIISGSGNTIVWFRLEMIKAFKACDYEVYALAPDISEKSKSILEAEDINFIQIRLNRKSLNPFDLLSSIFNLIGLYRKIRPDLVFSYTHKAILASSFASIFFGSNLKHVSMISGIGHIFYATKISERIKKFFALLSIRLSLAFNELVFFQNKDDIDLFIKLRLIQLFKARLVNGSGVDLNDFKKQSLPSQPVFMTMARLLKSKGLIEYAQAAKIVKNKYPKTRFLLYGYPDDHQDSIAESEIQSNWYKDYGVEYMGFASDPKSAIGSCSIFVLLSYNEGTPRAVLESMSMGRPIITTNTRGCKETVIDDFNGFLVPIRDSQMAAKKMELLLDQNLRLKMGENSRKYCEEKFDVNNVNKIIMSEVKNLFN